MNTVLISLNTHQFVFPMYSTFLTCLLTNQRKLSSKNVQFDWKQTVMTKQIFWLWNFLRLLWKLSKLGFLLWLNLRKKISNYKKSSQKQAYYSHSSSGRKSLFHLPKKSSDWIIHLWYLWKTWTFCLYLLLQQWKLSQNDKKSIFWCSRKCFDSILDSFFSNLEFSH